MAMRSAAVFQEVGFKSGYWNLRLSRATAFETVYPAMNCCPGTEGRTTQLDSYR